VCHKGFVIRERFPIKIFSTDMNTNSQR